MSVISPLPPLWQKIVDTIKPLESMGFSNQPGDDYIAIQKLKDLKSRLEDEEEQFYKLFNVGNLTELQNKMFEIDDKLNIMLPDSIGEKYKSIHENYKSKKLGKAVTILENKQPKKEQSKYNEKKLSEVANMIAKKGSEILNKVNVKAIEVDSKGNQIGEFTLGTIGGHPATNLSNLGKNFTISLAIGASLKQAIPEKEFKVLDVILTPTLAKVQWAFEDQITYSFQLKRSVIQASQAKTNLIRQYSPKLVERRGVLVEEQEELWLPVLDIKEGAKTDFGADFNSYLEEELKEEGLFKNIPETITNEGDGYTIESIAELLTKEIKDFQGLSREKLKNHIMDILSTIGLSGGVRGFLGELRTFLFLEFLSSNLTEQQRAEICATGASDRVTVGTSGQQSPIDTLIRVMEVIDSDTINSDTADPDSVFKDLRFQIGSEFGFQTKNIDDSSYTWSRKLQAPNFYIERLYREMTADERRFFAAYGYFAAIDPSLTEIEAGGKKIPVDPRKTQNYIDSVQAKLKATFNNYLVPKYNYELQNIIRLTTTILQGEGVFAGKNVLTNHFFIFHNIIVPASVIVGNIISLLTAEKSYVTSSFTMFNDDNKKDSTWMYQKTSYNGINTTFDNLIAGKENYTLIEFKTSFKFRKWYESAFNPQ